MGKEGCGRGRGGEELILKFTLLKGKGNQVAASYCSLSCYILRKKGSSK